MSVFKFAFETNFTVISMRQSCGFSSLIVCTFLTKCLLKWLLMFFAWHPTITTDASLEVWSYYIYIYINIKLYIIFIYMYVCLYNYMYGCLCMYVCMYVCMQLCMHLCMPACMHVSMYLRMYVCRYSW